MESNQKSSPKKIIPSEVIPFYATVLTMLIKDFGYERVRKIMRLTFTTFSSLNPREKSDVATTLLLTLSFLLLTKEEFENIISKWVGSLKQSDYDSYGFFDEKIARSMVMTMIEPFIIKIVNRGVNEDGVEVSGVSIEFDLMYMLYNTRYKIKLNQIKINKI
jgi:hypothetical protein